MKKFKISVLLIIGLILILLATTIISQAVSEIKTTVENAICAILRIFQALAAGVAALMIILQGVKWMTSEDPAGRKAAKDMITHVFVAMIIIIIAVQFVNYLVTGTGIAEFTSCPGVTGPIVPPKGVDDSCTISSECNAKPDLYCDASGVCKDKPGSGNPCAISIEGTTNLCKTGFECVSGTCKKSMNPPSAIIREKRVNPVVCMDFTLHSDSYDPQDGPEPLSGHEWREVECNTGSLPTSTVRGTSQDLTKNYLTAGRYCFRLKVRDSDNLWGISGSDNLPSSYTEIYVTDNNPEIVDIKVLDLSGNLADDRVALNEKFKLDATITGLLGISGEAKYSWTYDISKCTVTIDSLDKEDTTATITSASANCPITLTVKDACNAISPGGKHSKSVGMIIVSNQKPFANIYLPKNYQVQKGSMSFDGSSSKTGGNCVSPGSIDGGDSITKYEWWWTKKGSSTIISSATGTTGSLSITDSGFYTLHLKVTDSHNADCETSTDFPVCECLPGTNNKPIADASKTLKTGNIGTLFTFDASESFDPDNWDDDHAPPKTNAVECSGDPSLVCTTQGKTIRYQWRLMKVKGVPMDPPKGKCLCQTGAECYVSGSTCSRTFTTDEWGTGTYEIKLIVEDNGPVGNRLTGETIPFTITVNP